MNTEQRSTALRLAANALTYARVENWEQAGDAVQELHDTYEGEGIQLLLLALADTLLRHQDGRDPHPDAVVLPVWVDATTGAATLAADDVPPPIRWAGRFIAARAADDEPACAALFNSVTTDQEFTDNVCAVLEIVATSLNTIKGVPQ